MIYHREFCYISIASPKTRITATRTIKLRNQFQRIGISQHSNNAASNVAIITAIIAIIIFFFSTFFLGRKYFFFMIFILSKITLERLIIYIIAHFLLKNNTKLHTDLAFGEYIKKRKFICLYQMLFLSKLAMQKRLTIEYNIIFYS